MPAIKNLEGLSGEEINFELSNGGKFVIYTYCISIIVMTFKRSSDIYFIKSSESSLKNGLVFTLISALFGWWGIPWGPIYTIGAFITNFSGGKDVTQEVIASLNAAPAEIPVPVTA
ncbi:MAG: hypothetical protein EOP53_01465 [Sphingobacteriales bacterium]|nr:MAG: hypothetical protein EOP53_01465 [Sphingobacteriales bacterium]